MAKEKMIKETSPLGAFPMERKNYIFMIAGLVFIFLGFLLMIGGGSNDVNVFNEAIFGVRRITIAPILIVIGFIVEIYAIMAKPTNDSTTINE